MAGVIWKIMPATLRDAVKFKKRESEMWGCVAAIIWQALPQAQGHLTARGDVLPPGRRVHRAGPAFGGLRQRASAQGQVKHGSVFTMSLFECHHVNVHECTITT